MLTLYFFHEIRKCRSYGNTERSVKKQIITVPNVMLKRWKKGIKSY